MEKIFTTLFIVLVFTINLKGQDNSKCGILIDGILADTITCWSFKEMSIVFPIKSEWKKYDAVRVTMFVKWDNGNYDIDFYPPHYDFKPGDFTNGFASNAEYGVFPIFKESQDEIIEENEKKVIKSGIRYTYGINGGYYTPTTNSSFFQIKVTGSYITNQKEYIQNGSNRKTPIYGNEEVLWKSRKICAKRIDWTDFFYLSDSEKKEYRKKNPLAACIDMSQFCQVPGNKFDLKMEMVNNIQDCLIVRKERNVKNDK